MPVGDRPRRFIAGRERRRPHAHRHRPDSVRRRPARPPQLPLLLEPTSCWRTSASSSRSSSTTAPRTATRPCRSRRTRRSPPAAILPLASARPSAGHRGQVQRRGHRRMDQRHQRLRHRRAVAVRKEFYLREGYAWVEVSAQNAGLNNMPNGLRNWSPTRYGSLNVTAGGTRPNDVLSYDIFSQAAAAVRNVPVVMGGLPVQLVVGAGQSQSASRLGTYINSIHVRDPIYDVFIITEGGEIFRNDLPVPVVQVYERTGTNRDLPAARHRQGSRLAGGRVLALGAVLAAVAGGVPAPRSRTAGRRTPARRRRARAWRRATRSMPRPTPPSNGCARALRPRTPPDFQFSSMSPITVARDAHGNALGAIRLGRDRGAGCQGGGRFLRAGRHAHSFRHRHAQHPVPQPTRRT